MPPDPPPPPAPPTPSFPRVIFVRLERTHDDAGEPYLEADAFYAEAQDGERVGVYELREVRIKRITHSLVEAGGATR